MVFSSLKLKAASTLSMLAPRAKISEFELTMSVIIKTKSEILALGSNIDKVEAAFNFKLENNHAFLPGAVSRKKQVVPQLTESFNG